MAEDKNFSLVSLEDLAGLSAPLKKLVKVIAAGMGNLYRPLGILVDSKAEAFRTRTIAAAQADAVREFDKLNKERQLADLDLIPEIAKRAQMRAAFEQVTQQKNLERIAASSTKYIGDEVSEEDVNPDWRTQFFKHARDVSDEMMREVWAQVLAREVATPGSYGLRTLEMLRLMSRFEAEAFGRLCNLVFEPNYIVRVPSGLDKYGVNFDEILRLQAAGLLQESFSLAKTFGKGLGVGHSLVVTHDFGFDVLFKRPTEIAVYMLTPAGRELRRLINSRANVEYVAEARKLFLDAGLEVGDVSIQWEGGKIRIHDKFFDPEKL